MKTTMTAVRRFRCGHLLLCWLVSMVCINFASRAQEQPASKSAEIKQADLLGEWGGEHLVISISAKGASLEFDCAHGRFDKALRPDRLGRFAVRGVYVEEHGGPILKDEVPKSHEALYAGKVKASRMTVTVTLLDTRQRIGTFVVSRGERGRVFKCR